MGIKNRLKQIAGLATAAAAALSICSFPKAGAVPTTQMRDITTMELVRDMGIGINLGNTMEAAGDWIAQYTDGSVKAYETAWGSPVITKEIIQGYADEGFGVLRIPVAWSNRMVQDGSYTIDSELTKRIHEIVDWTLETGMYAIINIHWDNGWVNKFPENKTECMKRYETMWTQISTSFRDYGDKLMFESQNEELGWDSLWNKWGGPSDKEGSYSLVNEVNQKFVDTVRKTGSNNDKRHLLISGYNTGIDVTCDPLFKMPHDPAGRCAVSVHYYTPPGFAILEEDADWGKATSTWGTEADFNELNYYMDMMKTNFIDKGIPVIVGEYGCPIKNKEPDSVRLFLSSVCKAAYDRQLCPVLWDTPGGHYDREGTHKLNDRALQAKFMEIGGKVNTPPTEEPAQPVITTVTTTQPAEPVTTTTVTTTQSTEPVKTTQPTESFFHSSFEDGADGWAPGYGAQLKTDSDIKFSGSQSVCLSDRSEPWVSISRKLDTALYVPGKEYSFSANVFVKDGKAINDFYMKIAYKNADGETDYASVAEEKVIRGEWVQLANKSFMIPTDASDITLYIETGNSSDSFYVDEAQSAEGGMEIVGAGASKPVIIGDLNGDGRVNVFDLVLARRGCAVGFASARAEVAADADGNREFDKSDVKLLQDFMLRKISNLKS